ncbi:MAG: hypothetical protein HY818_17710 [Acetobacterium woodii]|nr:hypothetical protein [Acetobacterium woodii]
MFNLNKNDLHKMQKRLIVGVLIIIVGFGIGFFISGNTESRKAAAKLDQQKSEKTLTSQEQISQYRESMAYYKNMDVDTFDNLPLDERLKYSQFVIDQTVSNGVYDLFYGEMSEHNIYAVHATPATINDDGQTIWDDLLFNSQISYLQTIDNDIPNKPFDASDAEKVLSSVYYRVGTNINVSNTYINEVELHRSLHSSTSLTNKYMVTNSSELYEGIDSDGKTVQYKIITCNDVHNMNYCLRAIIHSFENYDGTQKNIWLFEAISSTVDDFPPIN